MSDLGARLQAHVDAGSIAGAVALTARGDDVEVVVVGRARLEDDAAMTRDTIFRVASVTKPIMAAATMVLVDDGLLALDSDVRAWLPEIAAPVTVRHLLTSTSGWGWGSKVSTPAPDRDVGPDAWVAALAAIPVAHPPGEAFLYNTSFDLLGVLLARVTGQDLGALLQERLLGPLGMVDTGFWVREQDRARLAASYVNGPDGDLVPLAGADPLSAPPVFPSGAGGLVSTADDLHAFGRMLLGRGEVEGTRLLAPATVDLMTTNHLTTAQSEPGAMFLDGQGWGLGGGVDIVEIDPWNVVGRYGWVGGSGTSAYVVPSTRTVSILLTQTALGGPVAPQHLFDAWTHAAQG